MINTTNACPLDKVDLSPYQDITDIYLGVFFDGTNNNMNRISTRQFDMLLQKKQSEKDKDLMQSWSPAFIFKNYLEERNSVPKKEVKSTKFAGKFQDMDANYFLSTSDIFKLPHLKIENDQSYEGTSYSNIAFLSSLYEGNTKDKQNCKCLNIYIEGSGATAFSDAFAKGKDLTGLGKRSNGGVALGIGFTGVVALVSKAMLFVERYLTSLNISNDVQLHFDVFGFSRGATCARLFTYMLCEKINELPRKSEFELYLEGSPLFENGEICFLKNFNRRKVDLLGLFDTVTSIGFLKLPNQDKIFHPDFVKIDNKSNAFVNHLYNEMLKVKKDDKEQLSIKCGQIKYTIREIKDNFHCDNVTNYGLYSPSNAKVKHVIHIGALDEYRENFAFTNIGRIVPKNGLEILIPGCHSDVGGGYVDNDVNYVTLFTSDIYTSVPMRNPISEKITIDLLHKLKWISNKEDDLILNSLTGKSYRRLVMSSYLSDSRSTYAWTPDDINITKEEINKIEASGKIQFKHRVKGGYSNISLKMMLNWASDSSSLDNVRHPFVNADHPRISIPDKLRDMSVGILDGLKKCKQGKRYIFCVGDSFSSDNYNNLRSEYLTFSASDELNWGVHDNNWGNIMGANKPYRKNYTIARLMYMGDNKQDGQNNDSQMYTVQDCSEFNWEFVNVLDNTDKK